MAASGNILWRVFKYVFLPEGWPDSVAEEYSSYQAWDTIQQVMGFVNTNFASLAVYGYHGVGRPGASVARGVALTVSRDLINKGTIFVVAPPAATAVYGAYPRAFRMTAEILYAGGMLVDICAFETGRIELFWAAEALYCIATSMNRMVRACILTHFAKEGNNRDVVAKENNQDKLGKIFGLFGGFIALRAVGFEGAVMDQAIFQKVLYICLCVSLVHISCNIGVIMTLRVPPQSFVLRRTIPNGASVELCAGQETELVPKLVGTAVPEVCKFVRDPSVGLMLTTIDGRIVDMDGKLGDAPVKADETYDGWAYAVKLNDGTYQVVPKAKSAGSMFLPPGFPRTLPKSYSQFIAYAAVDNVPNAPAHILELLLLWRYVYGIGDVSKSPLYATYLSMYIASVATVTHLVSGLPFLTHYYRPDLFFIADLVRAFGHVLFIVASLCPLKWWFVLAGLSEVLRAWALVVQTLIGTERDRILAKSREVSLANISISDRNRCAVLTFLSSSVCIYYAYHLSEAGPEANPSVHVIVGVFAALQLFKLYTAFCRQGLLKELMATNDEQTVELHDMYRRIPVEESRSDGYQTQLSGKLMGCLEEANTLSVADIPVESQSYPTGTPSAGSLNRGRGKVCGMTLMLVSAEAVVYAGLVRSLSEVAPNLESCDDRCLQFKLRPDNSWIPNTGIWPFAVENGLNQSSIVDRCRSFGAAKCESMPSAHCGDFAGANTVNCDNKAVKRGIINPLERNWAGRFFVASTCAHSLFAFVNDVGLQLDMLGQGDAVLLQVLDAYALSFMAASALTWSSGAMELFFSPVRTGPEVCGCYYRMSDFPSMFALVLPLNLVLRLKTKVVNTMRAAIMEGGYLSTMSFVLPYDFIRVANVDAYESLLGVRGLGHAEPRRIVPPSPGFVSIATAKHAAKTLCWGCVSIVLLPLLLSSSLLTYRFVDLLLMAVKPATNSKVPGSSAAMLGLLGIYGTIFSQGFILAFFITATWRLYFILRIQFKDEDASAPHVREMVASKFEELRWAFK